MIGECFECEKVGEIDNHHVVPKSLGGIKTIPLCFKCHGLVHGKDFVKHRRLHKLGIERAKLMGKFKGRLKGSSILTKKYLKKYKNIIECLNNDMSYRKTANKCEVSLGLVQKINKINNLTLTKDELNTPISLILEKYKYYENKNTIKLV